MAKRCCWGKCRSDSSFPECNRGLRFVPLPEAHEERLLWMRLCGWPHGHGAAEGTEEELRLFVCSRHFVDGAPTPENPNPVPVGAEGERHSPGPSIRHSETTLCPDGVGPRSVAMVTIKEEPQEYDVQQGVPFQVDGETQTTHEIKQEDVDLGFQHEESSRSSGVESPLSTSSSESEDEASDPGEMAVVTIKEDYDSTSEEDFRGTTNSRAERSAVKRPAVWSADRERKGCRWQHSTEMRDLSLDGEASLRHSEPPDGLYICSDCGKDFFGETELQVHQRIHRVEEGKSDGGEQLTPPPRAINEEAKTPFRCSHCDKSFARKGQLNRHEFIHSGLKPFSCSDCGKCFGNKWQLSAHQKIHSGEKPYSCTFCDKCFIRKGELTVHLKRHTGDKPFNCSFCGKCFTTKGEVNIHQRRHVGDKTLGLSQS